MSNQFLFLHHLFIWRTNYKTLQSEYEIKHVANGWETNLQFQHIPNYSQNYISFLPIEE